MPSRGCALARRCASPAATGLAEASWQGSTPSHPQRPSHPTHAHLTRQSARRRSPGRWSARPAAAPGAARSWTPPRCSVWPRRQRCRGAGRRRCACAGSPPGSACGGMAGRARGPTQGVRVRPQWSGRRRAEGSCVSNSASLPSMHQHAIGQGPAPQGPAPQSAVPQHPAWCQGRAGPALPSPTTNHHRTHTHKHSPTNRLVADPRPALPDQRRSLRDQLVHQAALGLQWAAPGVFQLRGVQQHLARRQQRQQRLALLHVAHCSGSRRGRSWGQARAAAGHDVRAGCRACSVADRAASRSLV